MYKQSKSFINLLNSNRFGLLLFACLCLATVVALATSQKNIDTNIATSPVKVAAKLSQTKLVKGEVNTVYLDVSIKPPVIALEQGQPRASDLIVVLDRSGSMSGANKMPYAKAAIRDLLSRLHGHDRFALVSFANNALVHSPLVAIDTDSRAQLIAMVNAIQPGGGTNMSAGLNSAVQLLAAQGQANATKVLLLSDGQANQGITDLNGLSNIVAQLTRKESVLSAIGLGLDFNETMMSSLADYGMGQYAYLEDLSGLGAIFARSLNNTRQVFAAVSQMLVTLNEGVELVDAAGYPVSKTAANISHIQTGQLLHNNAKKFVMTFKVNAQETGELSLGKMHLAYQQQGQKMQQAIASEQLDLAVVSPENRPQAVASIDRDVYQQSWLKNNYGRMQKKLSHWVRAGNKDKADAVISEYREEVAKAEKQAAMPLASKEMDTNVQEMEDSVEAAFSGNRAEQEVKRKRAAKSMQMDSIKQQR